MSLQGRQFRSGRSPFDEIMHEEDDGTQWWKPREMTPYLGYKSWESMEAVIKRAEWTCRHNGHQVADDFRRVPKMIQTGKGTFRKSYDVQMDRYGCYLLAMNADPSKPEVAAAQQYFAVMTRTAELGAEPKAATPSIDARGHCDSARRCCRTSDTSTCTIRAASPSSRRSSAPCFTSRMN